MHLASRNIATEKSSIKNKYLTGALKRSLKVFLLPVTGHAYVWIDVSSLILWGAFVYSKVHVSSPAIVVFSNRVP